jgi:hypothetical protein
MPPPLNLPKTSLLKVSQVAHHTVTLKPCFFSSLAFATSAWKKAVAVVALGAVWYNVDQSMTASGVSVPKDMTLKNFCGLI